jgi:hypothetical protein
MVKPFTWEERYELFGPCRDGNHVDCAEAKPTEPEDAMGIIYCACDCHEHDGEE